MIHHARERGLTLLEVVIALLLFALMSMFLLSGHADATQAVDRARIERRMAELLRLRIDLIALEPDEYRDRATEGAFPANVSTRIVDEEKLFGKTYEGYRWEATITEAIGAGAARRSEVEGGESYDLLFAEEGGGESGYGSEELDDDLVNPEDIDRMLLIEVTVYPPGYDDASEEERKGAMRPRSAWTAVHLPYEETEEGNAR